MTSRMLIALSALLVSSLAVSHARAEDKDRSQPPAGGIAPQPSTLADQVRELQDYVRVQEAERQRRLAAEAPAWTVHVNPLSLLLDEFVLGVDRGVSDRVQLTAQASYFDVRVRNTDNRGGSIGAGVRAYLSNGYRGWYVAPTLSYRALRAENAFTGETASTHAIAATATTGRQWVWSRFMLRAGFGLSRVFALSTQLEGDLNSPVSGWALNLDGAFGIVF